jgi:hypothetical protein
MYHYNMNKEIYCIIKKLINIFYLLLIGFFLVKYSHTFDNTVEKLTGFLLGIASLVKLLPPVLAFINPDNSLINKDE